MTKSKAPITFEYNKESYKIYKKETGVIYIHKFINGTWDFVSAKKIIRKKLEEIDSVTYNYEETGKPKYNTRSLGAKLYKLLDKNKETTKENVKNKQKANS